LPFNTQYVWDKTETYTKRLIRQLHRRWRLVPFLDAHQRRGPYLVMMPEKETEFEYFDQEDDRIFGIRTFLCQSLI
jgi:hypothetical protein